MRASLLVGLLLVAGCASSTRDFLSRQEGYRVHSGYVIQLTNLENPKVETLKDGKAFHVTAPGATLVLEHGRRKRSTYELEPGDIFVQSRPFSYLLQAPRTETTDPRAE
jgi:hypothetical protein